MKPGSVTATFAGTTDATGYADLDPFNPAGDSPSLNWFNQGADAGRYTNDDIHAIRILAMEPTTDRNRGPYSGRTFRNHANERLRILGEIPVRKFTGDKEPTDPDGNPDTSFLAKIPADVGFTFQTLDRRGMVLNMAQTCTSPPRRDCNDCGAPRAQPKPTDFNSPPPRSPTTRFSTSRRKPAAHDEGEGREQQKVGRKDQTGLKYAAGVKNVEYFRDVKPILDRSCVAATRQEPAGARWQPHPRRRQDGNLPDADDVPARTTASMDYAARFGHKPSPRVAAPEREPLRPHVPVAAQPPRLKIFGERLDGWTNDDFPPRRLRATRRRCN